MSIIGESFDDYVQSQIEIRQRLHGKKNRNNSDLNVLSNQNAWIKLASSVEVIRAKTKEELKLNEDIDLTDKEYAEYSKNFGDDKLKAIGLTNVDRFMGTQLAEKAILFNGLSALNPSEKDTEGNITKKGRYSQRAGVLNRNSEVWNSEFAYGLGGTTFGIVPPPGITDITVDCKNRGSIREARVNIIAQNKFQFELIELLYLRLGYSMMLEWGWDKYQGASDGGEKIQHVENTIIEDHWFTWREKSYLTVLDEIENYRDKYDGNYDGFLGKVVNFDWTFNPDGTYDIMIKLITVGDVIESLTVNLPQSIKSLSEIKDDINNASAKVVKIGDDAPLISGASTSTLAYDLFKDIVSKSSVDRFKGWVYNKDANVGLGGLVRTNYYGFYESILGDSDFKAEKHQLIMDLEESDLNTDRFNYFLTFGELLRKVQEFCIPSINQDKILDVDTSEDQLCSIYPYQVSLDPKVCIVKPAFSSEFSFNTEDEYKNGETGIVSYWKWMKDLKPFAELNDGGAIYGRTMNIYLNYDFVSATLNDVTTNGEIKLFTFLKKICDGINGAMGGLMKIEPVLRKDKIIEIIEQNPILGIQYSKDYGDRFSKDPVKFELYGFNPSGSVQTSNFVRNFNFNTTIGPNIASMITIGATAEGIKTKNYDGTGFANWNKGLLDRYQIKYNDPKLEDKSKAELIPNEAAPLTVKELKAMFDAFTNAEKDTRVFLNIFPRGNVNTVYKNFGLEATAQRIVLDCPVTGKNFRRYTWTQYSNWVRNWKAQQGVVESDEQQFAGTYINWLIQSFGGKVKNTTLNEFAYYYNLNGDFITQGKQLFKAYAKLLNNEVYKRTGQPSNSAGFIPVGLDIECDGISGVKIYNGIDVRQEFLPPAYPNALSFIISQVNHKISDNDWTTNLQTISTANTKKTNFANSKLFTDLVGSIGENLIENVVYTGTEPTTTLTSGFDVRNPKAKSGLIYYPEVTNKTQVVIHHTAGYATAKQDVSFWREKNFSLATHYIIERSGFTEHVFADKFWSNHIGAKHYQNTARNKGSFSIELQNIGWLVPTDPSFITSDSFVDAYGNIKTKQEFGGVSEPYMFDKNNNIVKMKDGYKGKKFFQSYTVDQLKALWNVISKWKDQIDLTVSYRNFEDVFPYKIKPGYTVYKTSDNAFSGTPGFYTHNSFRADKIDVFPQKELLEMLYNKKPPTSIKTV